MAEQYILVIDGRPQGPFSLTQLKELNVKPNDFLKTAGMHDYKEAHEIQELRELFGFSRQAHLPQYFGSFDQRLLASALDWFFVSGACIVLTLIVALLVSNAPIRLIMLFSLLLFVPSVNMVYHIIMESSVKQATYGKQLLKIKVCDLSGERITLARAIGRNLAKAFSVLTFFTGYLISFFNKKQQCLHDMIAGTLVMKDRLF
ncbi:MAG TPA: RDD family protein [Mucilaginibacter sp.]|nr:RDD family protein [Mucilaginibacter sp.]